MFSKYSNGAWEEAGTARRYANSAWQDCESIKRYKNSAWEDIWSDNGEFATYSNNITNAMLTVRDDGNEMELFKFMDGSEGSLSGGGTIVLVAEGEWENPTIEFEWEGEMIRYNSSWTTWYTASAGTISLYTVKTGGTTNTVSAVSSVGKTASGTDGVDEIPDTPSGTYSTQLSGTYKTLGLSIYFSGWSSTFHRASSSLKVRSVKINGKEILFSQESEFDNMIW